MIGPEDPLSDPVDTFEPADVYVIDTLEKLRVVSNPLRMRILDAVIPQARTIKEIGELLQVKSNTRYYHMSALSDVGMVRVVRTVVNGGIQQKYYRATGKYFRLEPHLLYSGGLQGNRDPAGAFLIGAVERTTSELRKSLERGLIDRSGETMTVTRRVTCTTQEQARQFKARLKQLEEDFVNADSCDGDLQLELGFALFQHAEDEGSS